MNQQARQSRFRSARAGIGAVMVTALIAGAALAGSTAATAAPPEVTFSLVAIDAGTGAPVTEITAGQEYQYSANVGCPDPNGCGTAELQISFPEHVEFLEDGFHPPVGATAEVLPPGSGTSRTVTVSWDELSSTAVLFLPARVNAGAPAALNGSAQAVLGTLTAGLDDDELTVTDTAEVTLRVYEQPGVADAAERWSATAVEEGSRATVERTVTVTSTANTEATLALRSPGSRDVASGRLPVSEAFDLTHLTLTRNPGGAEVTLEDSAEGMTTVSLAPGELSFEVPESTVGYTVELAGIPATHSADTKERTVAVVESLTLRDTQRTTGERLILPAAHDRGVQASTDIVSTVHDPAPGAEPSALLQTSSEILVSAQLPAVERDLTWVTASGDATSVYGSREASTATVSAANAGAPVLSELSIEISRETSRYFEEGRY